MYNNIFETAVRAALRAGNAIMEVYSQPTETWEVEAKADNSPLTIADRRAHAVIAEMLAGTGLPILSEEGDKADFAERKGWKCFWLVDPLDGTKEFLKRNGEFTVNIALIEYGSPVFGVVYVPVADILYTGSVNQGAQRIDYPQDEARRKESPLPQKAERPYTVVASRSHLSPETEQYIDTLRKDHPGLACISAGSSLKLCRVAEGQADVYPRFAPTMEWDTAAGDAIVRAAGGEVVNAETGTPLIYNKPDLHNPWFIASAEKTNSEN